MNVFFCRNVIQSGGDDITALLHEDEEVSPDLGIKRRKDIIEELD
jgi:hypothetical protein